MVVLQLIEKRIQLPVFFLRQGLRQQGAQRFFEQLVASPQNIEAHGKRDDGVQPQPACQRHRPNTDDNADGRPDVGKQVLSIRVQGGRTVLFTRAHKQKTDAQVQQT